MRTLHKLATLLLLLLPLSMMAQQVVSGVVTEAATGTPLPGVNVIVKGTTKGTATDFDGKYQIEAENGAELEFTYIGFVMQTAVVKSTTVNVAMAEDSQVLDEVVVIGYGTAQKKDVTGAVDLVSAEDFNQGPIVSPQQMIQGKIAGVSVVSGSGAPGEGSNILIRGISSLTLNSNPLIVVDGVPLNSGGVAGERNPLNLINPNDIESFTVLKDASATSIYGSRAANGVILITTKKGKVGGFKFNYKGNTAVYEPTKYVDVLNASEFRTLVNTYGTAEQIARLGDANTNWQDVIYNTAFGSDHAFSATGAVLGAPMRASAGYTNQSGILKGDELDRFTASLSITPRFFNDALKTEINARYYNTQNVFANRGAIGAANAFDPTKPVYDNNSPYFAYTDANGNPVGYYAWLNAAGDRQLPLVPANPLALLERVDDQSEVNRFVGNIKLDYKLPFLEGFTATVNAGYDESDSDGFKNTDPRIPTAETGFDGQYDTYTNNAKNYLLDIYGNWVKEFGESTLNATAGYSYQRFEFNNSSTALKRILNTDGSLNEEATIDQLFIDKSRNVLLSYFGRLNYDIQGKYLVTATLRADASSKLNPDDRWGYFPSVALAWNIHNENFIKGTAFDQLKLRLGYGEVGNVNGLGDYNFLTRYVGSTVTGQYQFGNSFYQTFRPEPINEDLRWEVGNTLNAGIDFSLYSGRISGAVNAYIKKTEDLIANTIVDPFTNFGNVIAANIGDMENKGIEVELGIVPVRTEDFEWSVNFNASFNDNEITRLPDTQEVGGISGGTGNTIQIHQEGASPFSFYVYKQIYNEAGKPIEGAFADINGDGQVNSNDRYLYKDPYADILMGLNTSITWKNWDFQAVTRASIGNYAYNNVASTTALNQVFRDNILNNIHSDFLQTGFNAFTERNLTSDYFIQNASFFRMDNITLGYTLKEGLNGNPLRVYAAANNLFVITNYDGLDPEITGGIDNNFYPRPRILVLGLDLNF